MPRPAQNPPPGADETPDGAALQLRADDDGVLLRVRVSPRASRSGLLGVHDGALKVGLTAPPVEGAANAALVKLLSRRLGVARGAVRIHRGEQSRDKTLHLRGLGVAEVRAALESA